MIRRKTDNTMAKRKSTKTNNGRHNTTQKTKDWGKRTPLKTGELRYSGKVRSSLSTNGTRITLVKNPVISHEWEKDRIVMTNEMSMVICETVHYIIVVTKKLCHNNNPTLSSFTTCHWVFNNINTVGATSAAVTTYHLL